MKRIILLLLFLLGYAILAAQASTPLPASVWYAVAWVAETDSLHWINADGEQGSIARPSWTEEVADSAPWLAISPNGRILVQVLEQANGYEGIAFYDLQAGQFLAVHQAEADESFITTEHYPTLFNSSRFAIGLSNPNLSAWRIINFDLATGAALGVLGSNQLNTGLPNNQYYPSVMYYGLDEGLGQSVVYFQMHSLNADNPYSVFYWYPEMQGNNAGLSLAYNDGSLNTAPLNPMKGFDIAPLSGFPALVMGNGGEALQVQAVVNGQIETVVSENDGLIDRVQWLNGGAWLGYRYSNAVYNRHWRVLAAASGTEIFPIGPNFGELYATPDGYLAQDSFAKTLQHVTSLEQEGFSQSIGLTIFQANSDFEVLYVTPLGANFELEALPSKPAVNVPLADNNQVQAPQACGTAPSPRLSIGETAQVTYTDGTSLNLRNAPSGDLVMQLVEGTVVTVAEGPVCADNYYWWRLELQSQGVTVGGWAAEGSSDNYFLQPFVLMVNPVPDFAPTATPQLIIQAQPVIVNTPMGLAPTATPQLVIQAQPVIVNTPLGLAPTATPAFIVQINCPNSPSTRLAVGMSAAVENIGGTLSFYADANAEFAQTTLPANQTMQIIGGSQCRSTGQRMWQISTTHNGQNLVGWVSEGHGQTYYLRPN